MNIKNISQILKINDPQRSRLFEGSIINGKILSNEDGKGAIKLYDGTIIPAIFISDNTPDSGKNIKFVVQGFDGENFVLRVIGESEDALNEKSLNSIINDLNIPFKDGKNIIMSLLKYNLPATNENMNSIYKNISFLNNLKNMDDSEILLFLKEQVNPGLTQSSEEFKATKNILSNLKNVNLDFLSFMVENDIPQNLDNIFKTQDFMNNKFFFNSFIDNVKDAVINSDILLKDTGALSTENEATSGIIIDKEINIPSVNNSMDALSQISNKIEMLLSSIDSDGTKLISNISKSDSAVLEQLSKKLDTLLTNRNESLVASMTKLSNKDISLFSKLDNNIKTLLNTIDNFKIGSENYDPNKVFSSNFQTNNEQLLAQIDKNINTLLNNSNPSTNINENLKLPQTEIFQQLEKAVNTLLSNFVSKNEPLGSIVNKELLPTLSQPDEAVPTAINKVAIHNGDIPPGSSNTLMNTTSVLDKTIIPFSDKNINEASNRMTLTDTESTALKNIKNNLESLLLNYDKSSNQSSSTLNTQDKAALLKVYDTIEKLSSAIEDHNLASINKDLNSILNSVDKSGSTLLSKFIKLASIKPLSSEKLLIDSVVQLLNNKSSTDKKSLVVASLEDTINIFKENKDLFSNMSGESYKKLMDNLDVFKQMNNNYNLYFFNLYDGNNIFKNNIIIKNKFKGSNFVDINDVKAFISVDTKNLGTVEGNLYKKNNDISISFNVNEKFVQLFKNNLQQLKEELKKNGYDIISLSVVKSNREKNLLPFSDFFNDSILKELDVKV